MKMTAKQIQTDIDTRPGQPIMLQVSKNGRQSFTKFTGKRTAKAIRDALSKRRKAGAVVQALMVSHYQNNALTYFDLETGELC